MTILIVPSWYQRESNPILGSFFREQAMMLQQAGEKVIVADATFQGREDYFSERCYKMKRIDDHGLLTYSYVVPGFGAFRSENGGYKRYYRNLRRIYSQIVKDGYKIDIIHAHSFMPAGIGAVKLGMEEKIPVVVTEHSSRLLNQTLSLKRRELLTKVVREANAFVCVSETLKKSVCELTGINETIVIPNLVDEQFCMKKNEREGFTFISIGNLIASKRFDLTLSAFADNFKGNSKVRLVILGDGVLRKELENLTETLGIVSQVSFKGRVSRGQVCKELQQSNVFVLPSEYETFGVVYIEAMACGLPIIGTRNGGAEEIITEENGILIDKNDLLALKGAMKKVYIDYDTFCNKKISRSCQERYGKERILGQIRQVYQNVINKI